MFARLASTLVGRRVPPRTRRPRGLRAPALFDRKCPEDFRRRLQLHEPTLDCTYFGDGQWIIVVYRGHTRRCREGEKLHRDAAIHGIQDLSVYQQAALMREGWAGLYQFAAHEPQEQHILEALDRFRASARQVEQALAEAGARSRGVERKALLAAERQDFIQTEARSIWRHTRRPTVFSLPS